MQTDANRRRRDGRAGAVNVAIRKIKDRFLAFCAWPQVARKNPRRPIQKCGGGMPFFYFCVARPDVAGNAQPFSFPFFFLLRVY